MVSQSSAELEYRVMTPSTCELIWIHQLMSEIELDNSLPTKLWFDNQAALHIVISSKKRSNKTFYQQVMSRQENN